MEAVIVKQNGYFSRENRCILEVSSGTILRQTQVWIERTFCSLTTIIHTVNSHSLIFLWKQWQQQMVDKIMIYTDLFRSMFFTYEKRLDENNGQDLTTGFMILFYNEFVSSSKMYVNVMSFSPSFSWVTQRSLNWPLTCCKYQEGLQRRNESINC